MNNYVYIGRFQPFHNGHADAIRQIHSLMKKDDKLVILVGSADQERTIMNPLSISERLILVKDNVAKIMGNNGLFSVAAISDSPYDYNQWVYQVQKKLKDLENVSVVGMENVGDYAYRLGYNFIKLKGNVPVHGSTIRNKIINDEEFQNDVSYLTYYYLAAFDFKNRVKSIATKINEYKERTNCTYPACFLTVDNLVVINGHVLLIRRKDNNKLAMPGGFQEPIETSFLAARRELFEETGLDTRDLSLLSTTPRFFDNPYRDYRCGRLVNCPTNVYYFEYLGKKIPKFKANDDAKSIELVNFFDITRHKASDFHGDHKKIICNILGIPYFEDEYV